VNLLVIGGLLVVGVVAIVIAVLLGIGEQRTQAARTAHVPSALSSQPAPPSQPAASERNEVSFPRSDDILVGARPTEAHTMSRPTTKLATSTLNVPAGEDATSFSRNEKQLLPVLNGQFHELVGEIRTLHRQAQQLEQRLSLLEVMVDHIEHEQAERSHPGSEVNEVVPPSIDMDDPVA